MKAMASDAGIDGLRVVDLPELEPSAGHVRVRLSASAVNAADYKVLDGEFAGKILHGQQRPIVVGYDVAGTVDAVGPGVTQLALGDEVFGFLPYARSTKRGAYAEAVLAPVDALARRPAGLTPSNAAALATAGVTALQALRDHGRLRSGQHVLIVGASGGVGSIAVGVARAMGATVTGLCSVAAFELVRALGAAHVVDYRAADALTGEIAYDVVFDAAAVHSYGAVRHLLRPGGAYVTTLPSASLLTGKLVAPFYGHRCTFVAVAPSVDDLTQLATWSTEMTIPVDSTYRVTQVGEALKRSKRGGMRGRIIIDIGGGFAA